MLLGQISHADIWQDLCRQVGTPIDFRLLEQAFQSTPVNDAMFSLAAELKKSLDVGIITDNKSDRMAWVRKSQCLDALFCPIVVSAEIGLTKAGVGIFEYALQLLKIRPSEALFIDNTLSNLEVAQQAGIETLYHDDQRNDVGLLARTLKHHYGLRF